MRENITAMAVPTPESTVIAEYALCTAGRLSEYPTFWLVWGTPWLRMTVKVLIRLNSVAKSLIATLQPPSFR